MEDQFTPEVFKRIFSWEIFVNEVWPDVCSIRCERCRQHLVDYNAYRCSKALLCKKCFKEVYGES